MRRYIFLLLLFFAFTGVQKAFARFELILSQYSASFDPVIPNINFDFQGDLVSDSTKYGYSLNFGPVNKVSISGPTAGIFTLRIRNISLQPGINVVRFFYDNKGVVETACANINFLSPTFTLQSVSSAGSNLKVNNNIYVVNSENSVTLNYSVIRPGFPSNTWKYAYTYDTVFWSRNNGINWESLRINNPIIINNLSDGLNTVLVKCPTSANYDLKYFKADTIRIFKTYFDLPEQFNANNEIWQTNQWVLLSGRPSGGWFTVDGENGTNYLNPGLLNVGNHTLTYHIPYGDLEFTTSKKINIQSYDFTIEGPLSVCLNQVTQYTIPDPKQGFTYLWEIEKDYGTISANTNSSVNVRWKRVIPTGVYAGLVKVTASHTLSGTTFPSKTILVNIKGNPPIGAPDSLRYQAYDPGVLFFGDSNKKLIICSVKGAFNYAWTLDDATPVQTKFHYNYFANAGNKYRVDIFTPEGCKTTMELVSNAGFTNKPVPVVRNLQDTGNENDRAMILFPNPANHVVKVAFQQPVEGALLRIWDSTPNLVLETKIDDGTFIKEVQTEKLPAGQYVLQVSGSDYTYSAQFIKVN